MAWLERPHWPRCGLCVVFTHAGPARAGTLFFSTESHVEVTLPPDGVPSSSSSASPPLSHHFHLVLHFLVAKRYACYGQHVRPRGRETVKKAPDEDSALPSPFCSSSPPPLFLRRKVRTRRNFTAGGGTGECGHAALPAVVRRVAGMWPLSA